jgi:hypothetical protein
LQLNSEVNSIIKVSNFIACIDGVIPANYANFGFIPYGRSLMGKIHFDSANQFGCDAFSSKDEKELLRSADITPFFVAKRGECSFV